MTKYNVKFIECHGDEEAKYVVDADNPDEAMKKAVGIFYEELNMQKEEVRLPITNFLIEVTKVRLN